MSGQICKSSHTSPHTTNIRTKNRTKNKLNSTTRPDMSNINTHTHCIIKKIPLYLVNCTKQHVCRIDVDPSNTLFNFTLRYHARYCSAWIIGATTRFTDLRLPTKFRRTIRNFEYFIIWLFNSKRGLPWRNMWNEGMWNVHVLVKAQPPGISEFLFTISFFQKVLCFKRLMNKLEIILVQ